MQSTRATIQIKDCLQRLDAVHDRASSVQHQRCPGHQQLQ